MLQFLNILFLSIFFYIQQANKLYEHLRGILKEEIQNSWFNKVTRKEALKVVEKIEYHISRTDFPVLRRELETVSYKVGFFLAFKIRT